MVDYEFTVPVSWDDITLEFFTGIKRLYVEDEKPSQTALLAYILNKEEAEVRELPMSVTDALVESMAFLNTKITQAQSNQIEIDGEIYKINIEEELKFGEYVDAQTVLEADENNLAAILAIVCRKEDEVYDDAFIAKELNSRIELFNKQSMTKIQPLINFFLNSSAISIQAIQSFSEALKENIMTTLEAYENSLKNGHGKGLSTALQMIKLRRLKKSLKRI